VCRSTPAITSLLAKVWRLQCHVKSLSPARSTAARNQPRGLSALGNTRFPSDSFRNRSSAERAVPFKGTSRGSPFLVLGR
jgi:hypothetical protein